MDTITFLRQFRLGSYAIFDIVVSFVGIYILSPLLSKLFLKLKIRISRRSLLYFTLPLGILVHLLVGTITPMTKDFLDLQGNYILKIFIIALFMLGMKDVKIKKK